MTWVVTVMRMTAFIILAALCKLPFSKTIVKGDTTTLGVLVPGSELIRLLGRKFLANLNREDENAILVRVAPHQNNVNKTYDHSME